MGELGTVISTFEGPSTAAFSFVISSKEVRKGQFIQTQTEDGLVIGFVSDVTRANRYFERPESVAEYEKTNSMSHFPVTEWEYVVANVKTLGLFRDGLLSRSTFPPAPGAKVFAADSDLLKKFLGFEEGGINVGRIEAHNLEVNLKLDRLFQKHLAVLGISGSGKSYCVSCLMEELLDRKPEQGRPAVVAIDVHGEYVGFGSGLYASRTLVVNGKKIRISFSKLSPALLADFLPEISKPQKRALASIFSDLKRASKEKGEGFELEDLVQAIQNSAEKEALKSTLISWVSELKRLKLFGGSDFPSLKDLAAPGRLCILDLSDLDNQRKKQLIVAYFSRRLFNARKKEKIPPFVLFVEEAHNFAPEKTQRSEALSRGIIETIAREGRKFGASLCLISQRPVRLSTTALSQCNSNIILRVTNPFDVKHIGESCEGIDRNMLDSITTLRTGEALLLGEAASHPIFFRVRSRRSRSTGRGESLQALAKRFEQSEEKKKSDVEAFL